ncbi:MAG: menaquinone biosynthesis protein [Candidatus Lindowbacteria bacterium]|nr:menaquinone biosynthesis protein [Candidatus Lindowbacteria bacterium]
MNRRKPGFLRLGGVPFLNARPLVRYLNLVDPPRIELRLEVPSRLAQLMEQGQFAATTLPSIEYFRGRNYKIIPGISISADGAVESVRIFSKAPIEEMRSLALDRSSRTSVALAKIILKRKLGGLPKLVDCSPDTDLNRTDSDAMLLIGDPAMTVPSSDSVHTLDLGEEWKKLTGLPFVYAMWVARADADITGLQPKLQKARDDGLARLDEIAAEASNEMGLSLETCTRYLRDIMKYDLGERELEALRVFHEFAAQDGLCPGDVKIAVDNR